MECRRQPGIPGTAKVAKLVDALVLGTSGVTLESSSLSFRTIMYAVIWLGRERVFAWALQTYKTSCSCASRDAAIRYEEEVIHASIS